MIQLATLRLARPALAAFFAMGILWGSFAADLPDIKTMLQVGETRLGFLLFMTPISAMLAMGAAASISERLGGVALGVTTLAMALAFALPGQIAVWYLFPLAMLVCGATTGAVDVLMNARVSAMEVARGRPLMNLCHAAYSFGYAGGALGTGALRSAHAGPGVVMAVAAALAALVALATFEADGRIDGLRAPPKGSAAGLGLVPVIGGAIVLIAFLTENAAENWSALHIEQTLHGSAALGSAGPAVLALTMGTARLLGHGLSARVSPVRLLLAGSAIAATGALSVALVDTPLLAYAVFIVMGVGSSVISPTAFTLVGATAEPQARARAVARATMLGYAGYFVGPPTLGIIAGSFGLRAAFVFAAAMLAFVWLLAPLLARQARR
ncbi:MAG: MFS transporter [Sphingomonadales bacterium 17-56-6]|nr:MAG: MFS transporter [Sphingomonadales bacterium 17-56-6]